MAIFKPYKIKSSQIDNLPVKEGQIIFTTDTKEIYLDNMDNERILFNEEEIGEVNGNGFLYINNAAKGNAIVLKIKGKTDFLYPSDNLYPSDDLYLLDTCYLIIDKTKKLSKDAIEISLPIEKLEENSVLIFENGKIKIEQSDETKEIGTIEISLFEGDNYIYLKNYHNNINYYCQYNLKKNKNSDIENLSIIYKVLGLDKDTFDITKTYEIGDYVIYNNKIYKCASENKSTPPIDKYNIEVSDPNKIIKSTLVTNEELFYLLQYVKYQFDENCSYSDAGEVYIEDMIKFTDNFQGLIELGASAGIDCSNELKIQCQKFFNSSTVTLFIVDNF
jgi:hypothetical protein